MILFILFLFLFLFYCLKANRSIATYVLLIYVISLAGTYVLSPSKFSNLTIGTGGILYLISTLLMVILPWARFKTGLVTKIKVSDYEKKIYKLLIIISGITFVINLVAFIFLQNIDVDINAFRYAGDSTFYLQMLPFPVILVTFATLTACLSLFLVPYHFYFLSVGNTKNAIASLVLSCNFILNGLVTFSRSTMVLYVLMYGVLFMYLKHTISFKKNKLIIGIGILLLFGLVIILSNITNQRFGGENEWVGDTFLYKDSIIKNPTWNSLISYLSQWYIYATKWIDAYDGEMLYNRATSIFWIFGDRYFNTSATHIYLENLWNMKFGRDANIFLGISTNLLYNFGFFITYLLLSLYVFIVKNIRKKNQSIVDFILIVVFSYFAIIGIFGNALNDYHYYMLIFVSLLIKGCAPSKI